MALAECLLYEGRSLESARGPQSFRTIPSRQLLTGEPCAGEPHARFGGRGVRLNRTSLPLFHVSDWGMVILNKTCRFCPACELVNPDEKQPVSRSESEVSGND